MENNNREDVIENNDEYESDFDDYIVRKLQEAEEEDRRGVPHLTHEEVFDAIRKKLNVH